MGETTGRSIGIDLGTTFSCATYIDEAGVPQVIPSREGFRTIPSVFAINAEGQKMVGKPAVDQEGMNANNTVRSIKRHMGTSYRVKVQDKEYSPEEISAEILKKIKLDAEAFLGEPVTDAVITVPAYFNSDQRQATKTAGELAGLNVLRVIAEPIAAALAYGLDKSVDERILVYDLGGGTFDVTVLEISEGGVFKVLSTSGDTNLGGDDFDWVLVELIAKRIRAENPSLVLDIAEGEIHARLREAAENAKKQLSSADTASISLPYLAFNDGRPIHVNMSITKTQFVEGSKTLIDRTKKSVDDALKAVDLKARDIDKVIFVGGSTRIPAIGEHVEQWLNLKPNRSINPDEAVGLGAAIQAGILSGEHRRNIFLFDVIPLSLGVELSGGAIDHLIRRNTTIPHSVQQEYTTYEDGQTKVLIDVYQGERPQAANNKKLGRLDLKIAPAPRGVPKIGVAFKVDANGILSVRGEDIATGEAVQGTFTGSSSLTSDDVSRMIDEADANKDADKTYIDRQNAYAVIKSQIVQVESLLRDDLKALTVDVIDDLKDLKKSLDEALKSPSLDLLYSLIKATDETVKEASESVYAAADEQIG